MKGKKRMIVTLLFFINIIMLVAAVIPQAGLACRTAMSHASSSPGKRLMLQQRMYDSFLLSHSIHTYG